MFPSFIPPAVIYSGLIEARLSVNDADFTSHETLSTSEWWILSSLELKWLTWSVVKTQFGIIEELSLLAAILQKYIVILENLYIEEALYALKKKVAQIFQRFARANETYK